MFVIVVDPFSSGYEYIQELKKRDIKVIAIISSKSKESSLYFPISDNEIFILDETECLNMLEKIRRIAGDEIILSSIPGTETGVELSDKISELLDLKSNSSDLTKARINKYSMQERIHSCGLKSIKQKLVTNLEFDFSEFSFPVVLKPTESAASDGVTFCKNKEDLYDSFNKYFGKKNKLGKINNELVLQEFISGTEYVVDLVANHSHREIIAIWEYEKTLNENGKFIYSALKLVEPEHRNYNQLINYSFAVMDALGIHVGPAHMEIMIDKDEPVLIEVGSRPHGGKAQALMKECFGYNQISRTVDLLLGGDKLGAYKPKKYGELVFLISNKEGNFSEFGKRNELENLPSFKHFFPFLKENDFLERTVDLLTIPGIVMFADDDFNLVKLGVKKLRTLEIDRCFYLLNTQTLQQ